MKIESECEYKAAEKLRIALELLATVRALGFTVPTTDSSVSHKDFCKAFEEALAKIEGGKG